MSFETVGFSAMGNSLSNVNVQSLSSFTSDSAVGGLRAAGVGFDNLVNSVLETNSTVSANISALTGGSYSGGTDVSSLSSYLSGEGSAVNSYLGSAELNLPSAQSLKDAFAGLNQDSSVADYTKAWLKSNYPNMSEAEMNAVCEQYAPFTQQMEEAYKAAAAEYGDVGTDANGQVDIKSYYMKVLDNNYPDMSAAEKESLCQQYEEQYKQTLAQYEKAAADSGLNENSTLTDYYRVMIKQYNPEMSDDEVSQMVSAYEKNSEPLMNYYNELTEAFASEETATGEN